MAITNTYQVFSSEKESFFGNTSAVILSERELPDLQMQRIAEDLCQPATTFLFPRGQRGEYTCRWFAPDAEITLCGHGSMAAVAFLSDYLETTDLMTLHSKGGTISGKKIGEQRACIRIEAISITRELQVPEYLKRGLGVAILAYFETQNKHIVLVSSEDEVRNLKPDFGVLRESDTFAYVVTAPGNQVDFVSRTFVPHVRQLEDPATGSSHAVLTPFWSEKTGKNNLVSLQLSSRGGRFECQLQGNDVVLSGEYKLIFEGETLI